MNRDENNIEMNTPEDFFEKTENDIIESDDEGCKERLIANDILLKSKGYLLFAVDEDGRFQSSCNNLDLNEAESKGLLSWAKNEIEAINFSQFGDKYNLVNEEDDETDEDDDDFDDERPRIDW